ncbi:hypothetical protein KDH_80250 [Dictyobacter sp. S3.2.2.5]|uniref:Uncharacterized protein n=1 Tax=Dictyobacter halimunensis TaxID=3026934 RepID=A0ABQ6G8N8_9CHLR|nr:hypothetical protein KDH_80250 [Dictyobacter sp. S3.2.2.5]
MTTMTVQAMARTAERAAQEPDGYEALSAPRHLSILRTVTWLMEAAFEQRHGCYGLLVFDPRTGTVQMFLTTEAELDSFCALIEWCITVGSYWPTCEALIAEWRDLWQLTKDVYDQVLLRKAVLA